MKQLTKRQKEVLAYIKNYITVHKFPPTIREISGNFQISVKGAYDHVKALERKETIRCNMNRSRAIEVLEAAEEEDTEESQKVPVLGNVAAGKPLFAEENFDREITLPKSCVKTGRHFALQVQGESMINAGIMDGDLAVFLHQNTAENGDIVVAMVDEAVTLKRFYKEPQRVRLQAENPLYPSIFTQNIRILGKLACIVRTYD
ncbi:MAG: transcriptional repressor LexA [Spirochaetales bacterium]|nr:transcriptional repressor LexA [Spirochaetales bacterium]MCF7938260.1 transcriptional repressor LexA [Spirochaetales bacterium]